MTFLAVDSQKSLFTMQKSQLQFEQLLIMNQVKWLSNEIGNRAEFLGPDSDFDNDPFYVNLQKQEQILTSRQKSLESQIQVLDNEIASLKTLVTNNIKSGSTLNLIGG